MTAPTRAVVLAGGLGKGMGPICSYRGQDYGNMPKSTLPICNKPNVVRVIDQTLEIGVKEVYISSHYMPGHVLNVVSHFPQEIEVRHQVEAKLHGSAKAVERIMRARKFPEDEPFWVLASSVSFPGAPLAQMVEAFNYTRSKIPATLGCIGFVLRPASEIQARWGIAVLDEHNIVQKFIEKPPQQHKLDEVIEANQKNPQIYEVSKALGQDVVPVNTSYYLLLPAIFSMVRDFENFGEHFFPNIPGGALSGYIMDEMIPPSAEDQKARLDPSWSFLGSPKDLWKAQWDFWRKNPSAIRGEFDPKTRSWIGPDVVISKKVGRIRDSIIGGKVYVGPAAFLDRAIVGGGSKLQHVLIEDSLILPYTYVNQRAFAWTVDIIRESVVGGGIVGGTFVDGISVGDKDTFDNEVAVPNERGEIVQSPLGLEPEEIIQTLRFLKQD